MGNRYIYIYILEGIHVRFHAVNIDLAIRVAEAKGHPCGDGWRGIHPWSLTWNLKTSSWNRRFLLETIIFRFHVELWGGNIKMLNFGGVISRSLLHLFGQRFFISESELCTISSWWDFWIRLVCKQIEETVHKYLHIFVHLPLFTVQKLYNYIIFIYLWELSTRKGKHQRSSKAQQVLPNFFQILNWNTWDMDWKEAPTSTGPLSIHEDKLATIPWHIQQYIQQAPFSSWNPSNHGGWLSSQILLLSSPCHLLSSPWNHI